MVQSSPPASAAVVHSLPGRTRLKVPRAHRTPHAMARVREALQSVPGVRRVDVNATTGSVLVHHDAEAVKLDDVAESLEAGTDFVLALVPPRERAWVRAEVSTVAHRVRTAFTTLDASISDATAGWVDLKMLVPIALISAAAVQVTITEGNWTAVPPYVLLYYAFDTFMKCHQLIPSQHAAPQSPAPLGGTAVQGGPV